MKRIRRQTPCAREDDLVVEELPDETLVYDLKNYKARCLNRAATLVWRRCDGKTTVAEMAAMLERELDIPAQESVVWMALDRLDKAHLLKDPVTLPPDRQQYSRRVVIKTLGKVAGIALVLPVVESITAPVAAQQSSCVSAFVCEKQMVCGQCINGQICGSSTECCGPEGSPCVCKKHPCP